MMRWVAVHGKEENTKRDMKTLLGDECKISLIGSHVNTCSPAGGTLLGVYVLQ